MMPLKFTPRYIIKLFFIVILMVAYRNWNFNLLLDIQKDGINWRDKVPHIITYKKPLTEGVHEISSILDEMDMQYPSLIWFYTGWIQDLDVAYDVNRWKVSPLLVHVIPFSHNDPGWLHSYEDYFQLHSRVILNLALRQLNLHKNMTFAWSEVCFLKMWYESISRDDKDVFRRLLKEERFEILTGGMVMPDEAIVSYYAFLNVLSEGHIWLQDEFNYSVSTAWSLDSFGHSSTFAYFLKLSGIDRTFIQRTHYALKKHLAFRKEIEFRWMQPWDENTPGLFTHMSPFLLYSLLYSCGPSVQVCCQFEFVKKRCWSEGDYKTADAITDKNVKEKSLALLEMLRKKAQFVGHNNVLLMVGDDFSFQFFDQWMNQWGNMQKIFDYLNDDPEFKVRIKYSTIGQYLRTAEKEMTEKKISIPKLSGDFYPYSDRSDQYWSGFYSTRPKLKSLIRSSQSFLRSSEILFGLISSLKLSSKKFLNKDGLMELNKDLSELRNEFAIYQHHDTITGTSRLDVIEGTHGKLIKLHNSFEKFFKTSILHLQQNKNSTQDVSGLHLFTRGSRLSNFSEKVLEVPTRLVIFNSLPSYRKEILTFHVGSDDVEVFDGYQNSLLCQTNPAFTRNFTTSLMSFEVHVEVRMKPLSLHELHVLKAKLKKCIPASLNTKHKSSHMQNDFLAVHFEQGIIKKIIEIPNKMNRTVKMKFLAYSSKPSLNPLADKSGAYIFLPNERPVEVQPSIGRFVVVKGVLVSFVAVEVSPEIVQIVEIFHRIKPLQQGIRLSNIVDISKKGNYELSMVLKTSLDNDYFFTDLNGFQMMRRKWRRKFGIQGNFYPMTNMVFIEDDMSRVTLVSGQCHAVTSRRRGEIEVMLDRRLLQDDWRGLGEGVKDNVPISSTFTLLHEGLENCCSDLPKPSKLAVDSAERLDDSFVVLHQAVPFPPLDLFNADIDLPCGIHLVSWRVLSFDNNKYKFTITLHYYGLETSVLSQQYSDPSCFLPNARIPASKFSGAFEIFDLFEMNLSGAQIKLRLKFNVLELKQMEIKTWLFILFY